MGREEEEGSGETDGGGWMTGPPGHLATGWATE